jgi:RNA polymerase sigma-32 factor
MVTSNKNDSSSDLERLQSDENQDKKKKSFVRNAAKRVIIQSKPVEKISTIPESIEAEVVDEDEEEFKEVELLDDEILPAVDESGDLDYDHQDDFDLEDPLENTEPGLVLVDALQRYLTELRRYPLLSREDEKNVAIKAFDNKDISARNTLVTSNLRLVVKIAMEYRRAYSQILDLIQEGNAGLVQAVNRFNPYRGVKLSTYSAWWIRAYILKFLMDNKSLVRMGTTDAQRKLFFRLRGEAEKMYALTQKFDANLLAEKIGVEAQDVIEMQQRLTKSDLSLDTPVGDDNDTKQVDILASNFEYADDLFERKQLTAILKKEIVFVESELNERDTFIFKNRIMADEPITLQEVGEKYGITRERARQLEARVIKKIKDRLVSSGILK